MADPAGLAAVAAHPLGHRVKTVAYGEPNLSHARNLGIDTASGEIVAFVDDDAVAYPNWLDALCAPFADPQVAAAGGTVIGRNGISVQWGPRSVDSRGIHRNLDLPGPDWSLPDLPHGEALRTEGTNMAIRREVLTGLGGFDERFRYYLDDTDLNMRLTRAGHRTAFAPAARVLHHQAASERRTRARAPRTLTQIGRSCAAFLHSHAAPSEAAPALNALKRSEHARLVRHMVGGTCTPGDVPRLLRQFEAGAKSAALDPVFHTFAAQTPFEALHDQSLSAPPKRVSGWAGRWRALDQEARALVEAGHPVHLIRLTPTALYHHMRYIQPGIWLQTGGLFGRSNRKTPLFQVYARKLRVEEEWNAGPLAQVVY